MEPLVICTFVFLGVCVIAIFALFDNILDNIHDRFPEFYKDKDLDTIRRRRMSHVLLRSTVADFASVLRGSYRGRKEYFLRRYAPVNFLLRLEPEIRRIVPRHDAICGKLVLLRVLMYAMIGGFVLAFVGLIILE
jgi:hypothetical protein